MPDLVLLVHGTYAARREDRGTSWWQVGSDTYEDLRQRMPADVNLTEPDEVFHWSGENSERARIKAATALLSRLKELEKEGRGYHLVGHSHGGSVIWHTLRLATLGRFSLSKLRSWATVGTPFLRHQTHRATRLANFVRVLLGIAVIKPAYQTAVRFYDVLFRPEVSLWLGDPENRPDQFSLYSTPVVRLMELMHIPVAQVIEGIRVGGSASASGESRLEFLLLSPLGWLLMALTVAVIYVYLNLAVFFLRPVLESWQFWAELRLEKRACKDFGSRWLGLWSPDDEAINGLRATLDLTVSFVSRMAPQDRVLFSDCVTLIWKPYYWVLTPVFNSFLRPFLDRMVRSYVVKSAQGSNRPGVDVVEVTPVPWTSDGTQTPVCLPNWLNEQLVQSANSWAREIIPKLRSVLAAPSFVSGLESWGKGSLGRELVHTSYFDHPEILDLLSMHIAWSSQNPLWAESGLSDRKIELVQWLADAKSRVGGNGLVALLDTPSSVSANVLNMNARIKPRRRNERRNAA